MQPVLAEDVAGVVVGLLENEAGINQIIPVVGPQVITLLEYLKVQRLWLGLPPAPVLNIPSPVARIGALFGKCLSNGPLGMTMWRMLLQGNVAVLEMTRLSGVGTASVAVIAGVAAMVLRKGSVRHRMAGTVFGQGMLCMTISAIPLGLLKTQTLNALVGALAFYLVASGWMAARHARFRYPRLLHVALGVVALGLGALLIKFGIDAINSPSHVKDGEDASGYFFFGAIAVLGAALDLRLVLGGIGSKHRFVRHLWRMNFALAIGIISVTPRLNRLAVHPVKMDALLVAPTLVVLLFMSFWLWRVLAPNRKERILAFRDQGTTYDSGNAN